MAALELRAPQDLMVQLATQTAVRLSLVGSTATDHDDGTWSVIGYADEDQVGALEALGYTVRVVTSDATLLARWDALDSQFPNT
jgi:hypothetical protein